MPPKLTLQYVCPRCGRKLLAVNAYEYAAIAVRRTCGRCRRRYALTITPIAVPCGWAHSTQITEIDGPMTVIK